ncbi:hypothetical protein [Arthrobacter sp. ISL-65]|uniref:hypothetical protein n=1 Tax=Arthrobacter sp. ISL-65 TaxID=2819112 RepID=UPI002035E064|nr:hypothetical protein [Arthrobacter sp. ISL-65]
MDGFRLSNIDSDGTEADPTIHLLSADDWLAANQVTLVQGHYKRRFDVVLYSKGLPIALSRGTFSLICCCPARAIRRGQGRSAEYV